MPSERRRWLSLLRIGYKGDVMNNAIITASYNDAITINFTHDAWFNATAVSKHFGKEAYEWLRLESTIEYISKLSEILNRENPGFKSEEFIQAKKGKYNGGTWLHPKLAIPFARWLDVGFSIWCDMQVEKILHPIITNTQTPPEKPTIEAYQGCLTLEHQDHIKQLVKDNVAHLDKTKQAGQIIKQWSSIKKKYGCHYKKIPDEEYLNVVSLLNRVPIEGEFIPASHLSITLNFPPLTNSQAKRFLITQQRDEMLMLWPLDDNQMVMNFDQAVRELNSSGHYIAMKKESVSIAKMVMDFIPAQYLPVLIETAGRRLKTIQG